MIVFGRIINTYVTVLIITSIKMNFPLKFQLSFQLTCNVFTEA